MDEIVAEFLLESAQNLDRLDRDLRALARDPGSPQLLAGVFRTVHTIKGTSGCLALHRLEELTHAGEALLTRLRDRELTMTTSVAQLLGELVAAIRMLLAQIAATGSDTGPDIGRVLIAVRTAAGTDPASHGTAGPPVAAPDEPGPASGPDRAGPLARVDDRVAAAQLDTLLRLAGDLRTGVLDSRMQPMELVWSRFPRLVRMLGDQCGKQVRLQMAGSETELDRSVLVAIRDPLTHLVRNAVDHGIEPVVQRLAAGKPAHGTLRLHARTAAGQVVVEVADDGAGIDLAAVGSGALARGLVTGDQLAAMSAAELRQLVFQPGLSTAPAITRVSGRGVGMDVVKTNVEGIGGSVEIDSEPGRGTTCRLRIPRSPCRVAT
jgi:two-component system chemotaxis sensor kinase CheA